MNTVKKIRVLIVDDSAFFCKVLSDALSRDREIEVIGVALDAFAAREQILLLKPDVIILDIEMPRMDGITFLKIIMEHRPMPVIIVSSLTSSKSSKALEALLAGAVEVMGKPADASSIRVFGEQLAEKIKLAAIATFRVPHLTPGLKLARKIELQYHPRQLVVMGASIGGTEALKAILIALPKNMPGICIVQHIPPHFSKLFSDHLNSVCAMEVREAQDGDCVKPGLVLMAPGDRHIFLQWHLDHYRVQLKDGPLVLHHCPSVNVLFSSAAQSAGAYLVAALLTGMGRDGAEGMEKIRQNGGRTIAQNEASCVVYGMPRAAVELGVVDHVLPLEMIAQTLLEMVEFPTGQNQSNTITSRFS